MARCPGCLAEFDDFDGPFHRYIGASAACWHLYGRVLAGELRGRTPLGVDAYAAQHAVDAGRRQRNRYRWLDPAPTAWPFTLVDVVAGIEPDSWAEGVLESWRALHPLLISRWTDEVLSDHST